MSGPLPHFFGRGSFSVPVFLLIVLAWVMLGVHGFSGVAWGQEKGIQIRWACVAMATKGNEPKMEKVSRRVVLQPGDQLKMSLEFKNKSFAYVIYHNSRGEIRLLYPLRFYGPESEVQTGRPYYIPDGDAWMVMEDGTGEESIFLLVSTGRLVRLEELLGEYDGLDVSRRSQGARDILSEIQSLGRKSRDLASSAERPITMAGRVRGMRDPLDSLQPDVAAYAEEISAGTFYSRTITIERAQPGRSQGQ